MSMPRAPQNASAQNGVGRLKTTLTAWLSRRSTRSISRYDAIVHAEVAGSAAYSQLNTTSSAVNGLPSCQTTSLLRFQITHVPSRATPPLSTLGTCAARIGTTLPSGSKAPSGS
jgi:hypothetical protein